MTHIIIIIRCGPVLDKNHQFKNNLEIEYFFVGKSFTMFGSPNYGNDSGNYGAIFYAIIWLFRCVHERKLKTGAKFSLRVSAIEICGSANTIKDLLVDYINGKFSFDK